MGPETMNFVDSIKTCLGKYVDFQGRASRAEYWWFFLFTFIVGCIPFVNFLSILLFVPMLAKSDAEKPLKSYFILFRPFVAFGRYLRDSWREIRQVRWPNRKATWKMTLAVLVYAALFMVFLTLLDVFFTFIFDLLFKK